MKIDVVVTRRRLCDSVVGIKKVYKRPEILLHTNVSRLTITSYYHFGENFNVTD